LSITPSQRTIDTPRGEVLLRDRVSAEEMASLELDPGIGVFSAYRSILTSKASLTTVAGQPQANLALALIEERRIVGYCVLRPPQEGERWARLRPPVLFELFGETARGWRDHKLMRPMLEMLVDDEANDERILYIVGYSWTWDLDHTKKSLQEYRDTLIHLLGPLGFKQYPTNEPNISLRPENLFMARVGSAITKETVKSFHNLLFGMGED
jgi:acetoin utilization protein AcuA